MQERLVILMVSDTFVKDLRLVFIKHDTRLALATKDSQKKRSSARHANSYLFLMGAVSGEHNWIYHHPFFLPQQQEAAIFFVKLWKSYSTALKIASAR